MENLKKYISIAFKNKAKIEKATTIGCYNCVTLLNKVDIEFYEEKDGEETAICPKCGLDSVIDNISVEAEGDILNLELLKRISEIKYNIDIGENGNYGSVYSVSGNHHLGNFKVEEFGEIIFKPTEEAKSEEITLIKLYIGEARLKHLIDNLDVNDFYSDDVKFEIYFNQCPREYEGYTLEEAYEEDAKKKLASKQFEENEKVKIIQTAIKNEIARLDAIKALDKNISNKLNKLKIKKADVVSLKIVKSEDLYILQIEYKESETIHFAESEDYQELKKQISSIRKHFAKKKG